MNRLPTALAKIYGGETTPEAASKVNEEAFQKWYASWAEKTGIDPDPDNPEHHYDYRAAYAAGVEPQISEEDGRYHWDSRFKDNKHPNRFVGGIDTITGKPKRLSLDLVGNAPRRSLDLANKAESLPTGGDSSAGMKSLEVEQFEQPGVLDYLHPPKWKQGQAFGGEWRDHLDPYINKPLEEDELLPESPVPKPLPQQRLGRLSLDLEESKAAEREEAQRVPFEASLPAGVTLPDPSAADKVLDPMALVEGIPVERPATDQEETDPLEAPTKLAQMARNAEKALGGGFARFIMGDELVYKLKRAVAEEAQGGPVDSIWQDRHEKNLLDASLTFVFGETLGDPVQTIATLAHGDEGMRSEVMHDLVSDMAMVYLDWQGLRGIKTAQQKAIKAMYEKGEMSSEEVIKLAAEGKLALGPEISRMAKEFGDVWQWIKRYPGAPPRMIIKALNKVTPMVRTPRALEGVWEKIPVLRASRDFANNAISKVVNTRIRGLGFYERIPKEADFSMLELKNQSLAEWFQPAVERLIKKGVGFPFRKAQAMKALVTDQGQKFANEIGLMGPKDRWEMLKALRGEKYESAKVTELLQQFIGSQKDFALSRKFAVSFREQLQKQFKGDTITAVKNLDDYIDHPVMEDLIKQIDKGVKNPKQTRQELIKVIESDTIPLPIRLLARDLHDLHLNTPEAISKAARSASRAFLLTRLRQEGVAKAVLQRADDPKDWVKTQQKGLEGMWLMRDAELELRALDTIPKLAHNVVNKLFVTPWKTAKVILRPATHFRNLFSNLILNDWGGLPFYRMDYYHKAYRTLWDAYHGKVAPVWKEFRNLTGAGGTFSANELVELGKGERYGANMVDKLYALFDRFVAKPRQLYNAEEQWFKLAKFMWNRDKGMGATEAAWDSMKWTFNYGEITRPVAGIRQTVAPFFTWQSKVLPLMAETAVNHPVRFAKWPLAFLGIQTGAMHMLDIDDEEWEYVEHVMPDYVRDGQFLLVPWRDEKERLQLLNLTYLLPGFGDLNEIGQSPISWALGNPVMSITGTLLNRTRFTGAPLYYDWEDNTTKFAKGASYIWDQLMPAGASIMSWKKVLDTLYEQEDALTWEQHLAGNVGLKVLPLDMAKAARQRAAVDAIHRAQAGAELKKHLRDARTDSERQRIVEEYTEYLRQIGSWE